MENTTAGDMTEAQADELVIETYQAPEPSEAEIWQMRLARERMAREYELKRQRQLAIDLEWQGAKAEWEEKSRARLHSVGTVYLLEHGNYSDCTQTGIFRTLEAAKLSALGPWVDLGQGHWKTNDEDYIREFDLEDIKPGG